VTDRELIYLALSDAIDWQLSLADACRGCQDGQYEEAMATAKKYRAIMKRRYGTRKTYMELNSEASLAGAKVVSVQDIKR